MAYPSPRRLQLRRGNAAAVASYLGFAGELVVDTTNWTLYVHDGVTVGGRATTVNTASITSNITAITNGTALFGNIIPSANVTYSLGNVTHQWRDLYVSNTTIYIGGVPLSIDVSGNLTVGGNTIPTTAYVNQQVANVTVDLSSYALNANVTAANLGLKGYVDQANTIQSAQVGAANLAITAANLGLKGYVDQANTIQSAQIAAANVGIIGYIDRGNTIQSAQINSANVGMRGYVDSQSFYSNAKVATYLAGQTDQTIGGNLTIQGNLVVNGNVSYISVNNLVIGDNIINLADLNPADSLDLGFVAHRTPSGQPLQHTGLVRDAGANQWKLFSNVVATPGTTVDFTDAVYDAIQIGNITSPSITTPVGLIGQLTGSYVGIRSTVGIELDYNNTNFVDVDSGGVFLYTTSGTWQFDTAGKLTLPSGGGDIRWPSGETIRSVSNNLLAITAGPTNGAQIQLNATANTVAIIAGTYTSTFNSNGNVIVPSAYVSGNVTAQYFIGNGALLTGIAASSNYGNVQVGVYTNLSTYAWNANVTAANIGLKGYVDQANTIQSQQISAANVGIIGYIDQANTIQSAQITAANVGVVGYVNQANTSMRAYVDGQIAAANTNVGGGGGTSYGNGNVASYLITNGYVNTNSAYGNGNVASYLPTHTGNVGVNTLLGTTPNVVLTAGSYSSTFDTTGNVVLPNAYVTGNVIGQYILGNGAFLTGVVTGSSYSNVQVATYLPTYTGVVTAANVAVNGNVTAQYLFGNGSQLTGLPATYSNIQTAAYLNATGYNLYSNANVASYLPLYGGDISARNITVSGNIALAGNALLINSAIFYGNTITGFSALYAGIPGYTPIPQVIAQFTADFNGYAQINSQNLGTGNQASSDFIATANNGTDSAYFIDMGIAGSGYNPAVAANNNAIGTALTPNDAYIYTAGNTAANPGGNLVIGVQTQNKNIRFFAGGVNANNVVLTIQGNGITTSGNATAVYFIGNGSQLTGLPATYSNIQTKAYTETIGLTNYSNVNVKAYTEAMGFANYGDSNVATYLNTYTGNISAGYFIGDGSQLTGLSIPVTYSNVNVKAYTETMGFRNYSNTNVIAYLNATGYNLYSNVNVAAYLSTATINTTGNITAANFIGNISITGNVVGTSPNVTIQAGSNVWIFDNTGNLTVPANADIIGAVAFTGNVTAPYFIGNGALLTGIVTGGGGGGTNYSNVNVASYLGATQILVANIRLNPSGNIVFADGTVQTTAATGSYSNIQVATYLPTYTGSLNASNILVTSANITLANIQTTTSGINSATGALRVMGGAGIRGNLNVGSLDIPGVGHTIIGNINISGAGTEYVNIGGNLMAIQGSFGSINATGAINTAGNILAQNIIGTIATASQTGITAVGTLGTLNVTGNATVGNLIGTEANTRIIANVYTTTFDIYGNVTFPGNNVVHGMGITMPARPAFRVNGVALYNGSQSTANVNLRGVAVSTQYNQGGYFDATTGKFTAPVAGIYEVLLNARVNSSFNGLQQLVVLKNGLNTAGNIVAFWESGGNTSTSAAHWGVSGTVILAVGDYLTANILAGNVTFDTNDNWSVTYLG